MTRLTPISRKKLIQHLKSFNFNGPFPGTKHSFMEKSNIAIRIPNEHGSEISVDLLRRILKEARINDEECIID